MGWVPEIGMKNLTKRSFFSTSTKTVPINVSFVDDLSSS